MARKNSNVAFVANEREFLFLTLNRVVNSRADLFFCAFIFRAWHSVSPKVDNQYVSLVDTDKGF